MDFSMKQWRHHDSEQQTQEDDQEDTSNSSDGHGHPSLKLPKLLLNSNNYSSTHTHNSSNPSSAASVLPLFVPEPTTNNLSPNYNSSDSPAATKFNPRMGSSYFSLGQWQELELQALIFRHMIAGTPVPSELLHLVKKSLISSNPPPYYHHLTHSLHQYYPHYQPALVQSGYWGRGAMDPEPGRCRRTDGKKWRCSRDVVPGQKYCERHVHRGRNRSRKPVEVPTSTTDSLKTTLNSTTAAAANQGMASVPHFTLSGPSPSMDILHLSRRPSDSIIETKGPFQAHNEAQTGGGDRTLRHFFDDWPRSLHDTDNTTNSATNLSISTPGNLSSDFSLKLGTGAGDESSARGERERTHLNWGGTWEASTVAPMGGPLAEVLRSSTSNTSPTSVLHRLRASNSEASYVSS